MVEEDDRPKQLSRSARAPRLVSDNQQTAHMPSGTINTHHSSKRGVGNDRTWKRHEDNTNTKPQPILARSCKHHNSQRNEERREVGERTEWGAWQ